MSNVDRRLALVSDDLLALNFQLSPAMNAFKRAFLKQAMIAHGGNACKTAAALGIHRNTLCRQMDECELTVRECWKEPPARVIADYRLSLERKA